VIPHFRALLAVAASLLVPGFAGAAERPAEIGQPVPAFEATSLSGEAFSLETAIQSHKAVVVLFTSTVCPYANYFASHVRELSEAYGPRGVLFVGVNSNNWESLQEIIDHTREQGFSFPMIKDEGHVIAGRLGADRTPEAFLVDSTGRLRYRGRIKSKQESPDLQRALDAVLEGRPVGRPVTKAFGCAIDRN
jgi:peroxiredoxin